MDGCEGDERESILAEWLADSAGREASAAVSVCVYIYIYMYVCIL